MAKTRGGILVRPQISLWTSFLADNTSMQVSFTLFS
jgi:hypothetical protein